MIEIKIVSRWNKDKILICGKYENVKDCLEKNRNAYLRDADLGGANLEGANLGGAYLGGANLGSANLEGAYLGGAYLRGADLRSAYLGGAYLGSAYLGSAYLGGANLEGANLEGAYLEGAYLRGADLRGANLRGAKNYVNSHDFAFEIIRQQDTKLFTDVEWAIIGQIAIHRFCWETIAKHYKKPALSILKKLAKVGFSEYYDRLRQPVI